MVLTVERWAKLLIALTKAGKGQLARALWQEMNPVLDIIIEEFSERKINKLVMDEYRKRHKNG